MYSDCLFLIYPYEPKILGYVIILILACSGDGVKWNRHSISRLTPRAGKATCQLSPPDPLCATVNNLQRLKSQSDSCVSIKVLPPPQKKNKNKKGQRPQKYTSIYSVSVSPIKNEDFFPFCSIVVTRSTFLEIVWLFVSKNNFVTT
jgi:hypothetical protein